MFFRQAFWSMKVYEFQGKPNLNAALLNPLERHESEAEQAEISGVSVPLPSENEQMERTGHDAKGSCVRRRVRNTF
jgi:hypothetical protein